MYQYDFENILRKWQNQSQILVKNFSSLYGDWWYSSSCQCGCWVFIILMCYQTCFRQSVFTTIATHAFSVYHFTMVRIHITGSENLFGFKTFKEQLQCHFLVKLWFLKGSKAKKILRLWWDSNPHSIWQKDLSSSVIPLDHWGW